MTLPRQETPNGWVAIEHPEGKLYYRDVTRVLACLDKLPAILIHL